MEGSLEQKTFQWAADNCRWCKGFCEKNNHHRDNVYSRQALICLGYIKNSEIARDAEEACKGCDYMSERIISVLRVNKIKLY